MSEQEEKKMPSAEKLRALQLAMEKIEKDHGKGDEINQTVAETMYANRDEIYKCQAKLVEVESERNQKTEEVRKLSEELKQIKDEHYKMMEELRAIKNTRIYRLVKKIYHGKRTE